MFAQVIDPFNGCVQLTDTAQQELLAAADSGHNTTIALDGLGEYRVGFQTAGDGTTFVSGVSMGRENATIARLALTLGIAITAGLVLAALVAYVIVRRSLRPLDEVAATARQVTTVQLHRGEVDLGIRVPDRYTDPRTEVGQVGAALNSMLGHVSTALERRQASETQVRQFVADASHELRTPLAAIRGYTELARRDDTDQEAVSHALSRVDSESVRMSALVDDLLLLARLDAGRPLAGDEVDLTLLVMDVVSDARAAGPAHNWRLDLPEEPVSVVGDQSRLHQVIANLLTNARTHTPAGHDGDHRGRRPHRPGGGHRQRQRPGHRPEPVAGDLRPLRPRRLVPLPRRRVDRVGAGDRPGRGHGASRHGDGRQPSGPDDVHRPASGVRTLLVVA